MASPPALSTLDPSSLRALVAAHGAPAWRAEQLRRAAWQPGVRSLDDVHQLPVALRGGLAHAMCFTTVEVDEVAESEGGATLKLLVRLGDGRTVETVAMETPPQGAARRRATVCVSSQVGCAVGCPFCATGRLGLLRSCTAAEIVDQVRAAAGALHARQRGCVTHVVYMGMGEPLANLDATLQSIRTLAAAGISPRRITVSTSGLVPAIDRLAASGLPVTLAISLHAVDDALRHRLVPVNRTFGLAALLAAGERYATATGRRLSLEWCLIGGVNDSLEQALGLREIARRLRAHVNVIPMNRIEGSPWGPPDPAVTRSFLAALAGARVTVRNTRGAERQAACGQLRATLEPRRDMRPDGTLGPPRRLPTAGPRRAERTGALSGAPLSAPAAPLP